MRKEKQGQKEIRRVSIFPPISSIKFKAIRARGARTTRLTRGER